MGGADVTEKCMSGEDCMLGHRVHRYVVWNMYPGLCGSSSLYIHPRSTPTHREQVNIVLVPSSLVSVIQLSRPALLSLDLRDLELS
jgi:hypothetical protein